MKSTRKVSAETWKELLTGMGTGTPGIPSDMNQLLFVYSMLDVV